MLSSIMSITHMYCRCISSKEEDFKTIFDNFVQDLLITLNHPEWPAAELVVTQLGILLVCGSSYMMAHDTYCLRCAHTH